MNESTFSMSWDESDWLVLRAGFYAIRVGYIETYSDGKCCAYLYNWDLGSDDALIPPPKVTPPPDARTREDYGTVEIGCRSPDEAEAVIRALLGIRGVTVPPRRP